MEQLILEQRKLDSGNNLKANCTVQYKTKEIFAICLRTEEGCNAGLVFEKGINIKEFVTYDEAYNYAKGTYEHFSIMHLTIGVNDGKTSNSEAEGVKDIDS